jgi:hypothetical protein
VEREVPMRGIRSGSSVVLGIGLLVGSSIAVIAQSEEPDPMQAEAVAPTRVTGEIGWGRSCTGPDTMVEGDVIHERDWDCSPQTWTASDPRLSGEAIARWNSDAYLVDGRYTVVTTGLDILTNDAGGWVCTGISLYEGRELTSAGLLGNATTTCVGQDGYQGLTAVLVRSQGVRAEEFVGLIFSGDPPPPPEPRAAE